MNHFVYLFFFVDIASLKIDAAHLISDGTPCTDRSRYFPVRYSACWSGKTHQEAYDKACAFLRSPMCEVPAEVVKMALPLG